MTQPWQQDPYSRRPVDINAYAPPRRSGGGWWLLAVGVVLVGVVLAALFLRPPAPAPAPTPTPTAEREPVGPGQPFTMPGSTASHGRWEVLEHAWSDDGVTVRVRVTADGGRVSYGFAAFANQGSDTVFEPEAGAPDPEIGSGHLRAGESIEGNVFIPLPRGAATLILTTAQGRQMSALPIPA
ncbi:MAG: hypothetical protein Q4F65_06325 [Propionibacteriaceae bacterium]|nr:hypothetical protein [Propionibacteriaceae bacterium]